MKVPRIRLSRTFVLILGGALVLVGASGAAAVYIGADKLLGPSHAQINGLECTEIETMRIKRDGRFWVRKFVTAEATGDGMARVRTALRVARATQKREKADLVQVSLVNKTEATEPVLMRGRMVAAQVVYIPDAAKVPKGIEAPTYSAYYLDGAANAAGEYYGLRIDLPLEDVDRMASAMTDSADCIDPMATAVTGHGGKAVESHGGGHEAAPSHEEVPVAEGEGEGHGDGDGEEVAASDDGGFLASIKSMIFGGKAGETAPAHEEAPSHEEASADAGGHASEEHAPEVSSPAPEPRTAAEGGKRWSNASEADEIRADQASTETPHVDAAPPPTDGTTEADAAGAAWLAKFRGQSAQNAAPVPHQPASHQPEKHEPAKPEGH